MTATIIDFPRSPAAEPACRLLPRVAEPGDAVLILSEGVIAAMIGETADGRRAVLLVRGEVRYISLLRIAPLAPAPGTGGAA